MQLTISSRRDIAVLQKESSALEGEEDVKGQLKERARRGAPKQKGAGCPTPLSNFSEP
jgi:hypothetical protein